MEKTQIFSLNNVIFNTILSFLNNKTLNMLKLTCKKIHEIVYKSIRHLAIPISLFDSFCRTSTNFTVFVKIQKPSDVNILTALYTKSKNRCFTKYDIIVVLMNIMTGSIMNQLETLFDKIKVLVYYKFEIAETPKTLKNHNLISTATPKIKKQFKNKLFPNNVKNICITYCDKINYNLWKDYVHQKQYANRHITLGGNKQTI